MHGGTRVTRYSGKRLGCFSACIFKILQASSRVNLSMPMVQAHQPQAHDKICAPICPAAMQELNPLDGSAIFYI